MEPTILPEEKTLKRKYKHFTINAAREAAPARKLDFFYIGRKTANMDLLIKAFDSGYAAESFENGKAMLKRQLTKSGAVPDIIFIEASLGVKGLKDFYGYLAGEKKLVAVPLIIDSSTLPDEAIHPFSKLEFVDDIICLNDCSKSKLISKTGFWKKVKQQNAYYSDGNTVKKYAGVPAKIAVFLKRAFDIIMSVLLLAILSPLFLLIIVALRIESKGPFIYISKRAGRGYKIFNFYKFRTMEVGADEKITELNHLNQYNTDIFEAPYFMKVNNDPRVTRIGMFLRNTSLDELPQLVNVLKGDMSLVGNRPLPLYEAASLTTDEWAKRFMAPAGITGLWQIKRRGHEDMSVSERVNLDINYADKHNFLYDLWIIANTPTALIQKSNS